MVWDLRAGSYQAALGCWLGPGPPLRLGLLFQARVFLGRIHFLTAVESWWLASSRPAGKSL